MLNARLVWIMALPLLVTPFLFACHQLPAGEAHVVLPSSTSKPHYPAPIKLKPLPNLIVPASEFKRASIAVNAEVFRVENNVFSGKEIPKGVDFAAQRVAVVRVMLSSGSNRVVGLQVRETDDAYYVTYSVKRPRLGTADIKFVEPYAVLPADKKRVWFAERGGKRGVSKVSGKRIDVKTGLLRRS